MILQCSFSFLLFFPCVGYNQVCGVRDMYVLAKLEFFRVSSDKIVLVLIHVGTSTSTGASPTVVSLVSMSSSVRGLDSTLYPDQ